MFFLISIVIFIRLPTAEKKNLQSEHDGSDVQTILNADHRKGEDLVPNMNRAPQVKYITYYEDAESIKGKRTAVWELDKGKRQVS